MIQYVIEGGHELRGTVCISGAKNAALAVIPACILVKGNYKLDNLPDVHDIRTLIELLSGMGVKVTQHSPNCYELDSRDAAWDKVDDTLARKIRGSYYLAGACLGRFGKAQVALPGGCNFGSRPVDLHLKGFQALGATAEQRGGHIIADSEGNKLAGGTVYLDYSVGATANVILAAVLADGTTIIENAAKEPHIVDLANFLNFCGAEVRGAGTDVIKIHGKNELVARDYAIIPDQIEAGTYMAAVAATGGELILENVIPKHLDCISVHLEEAGVEITPIQDRDAVIVKRNGALKATSVKTATYPGFPTDMQPQMGALLAIAEGTSTITERIFENRFQAIGELLLMNAVIEVDGRLAVYKGVPQLSGAVVKASDLRCGSALVVAGLAAWGTTVIRDAFHIERGYEDLVGKLQAVGAKITRVELPPEEAMAADVSTLAG